MMSNLLYPPNRGSWQSQVNYIVIKKHCCCTGDKDLRRDDRHGEDIRAASERPGQ